MATVSKPLGVEWQVNMAMGAILFGAWASGLARSPEPDMPMAAHQAAPLAALEDAFARNPADRALARRLTEAYLEHDRPGLAVAALRSADAGLLDDPLLVHRLAQAYEASGRVADALATSELALARCARSLGSSRAGSVTPVPRHRCDNGLHAAMEVHRSALAQMVAWNVNDPRRDPRARFAYDLAIRRARVASARE
jgi:hypothetical protein